MVNVLMEISQHVPAKITNEQKEVGFMAYEAS
jgi:hypothetical protein